MKKAIQFVAVLVTFPLLVLSAIIGILYITIVTGFISGSEDLWS